MERFAALLALLVLAFAGPCGCAAFRAGARQRPDAGRTGRRGRAAIRRALDARAAFPTLDPRMARLLVEPGRCGAWHAARVGPARGLERGRAALSVAAAAGDRRADEPCLRRRLCGARAGHACLRASTCRGRPADRRSDRQLSRLHRCDLRPAAGAAGARARGAQGRPALRWLARRRWCRRSTAKRSSNSRGDRLRIGIPMPAASPPRRAASVSRHGGTGGQRQAALHGDADLPPRWRFAGRRNSARTDRAATRRAKRCPAGAAGDRRGHTRPRRRTRVRFVAQPGDVPLEGAAPLEGGGEPVAVAIAPRRAGRGAAAQHHALRLSHPEPQGALACQGGRRCTRSAHRCAGLYRGRGARLRGAGRGDPAAARGG